jgi:hypothetical protein
MKKKTRLFTAMLWIMVLVRISPYISAQVAPDATQSSLPPGVEISVKAAPEIATVGDPIRIELHIAAPLGYRVESPKPETQVGDFTILDFYPATPMPDGGNSPKSAATSTTQAGVPQHYRGQIIAAVYKTGKFAFPSVRIKLHAVDGKEFAFSTTPINIEIRSVLKDQNQSLKDLKKQAEIPERFPWILWCIIVAAALILGAALWIWLKRRRRRAISLSPVQVQNLIDLAEADLRSLLARGLPENGNEKKFYVLLSEIIKRILEAGYAIHTAEQTTSEIMSSLHKKSELEPEKTELIESFLLRCDVVKFAKYIPSRMEHEAATHDAIQILMEARKAVGSQQPAASSECGT